MEMLFDTTIWSCQDMIWQMKHVHLQTSNAIQCIITEVEKICNFGSVVVFVFFSVSFGENQTEIIIAKQSDT